MEYIPDTIYHVIRIHMKNRSYVPVLHVRCYMYQICRALAYIHAKGICHRDIKPHNILVNTKNHQIRLCDFGSAKHLLPSEPSISYICSRFYRAPELVCESVNYTTAIDMWSLGCVLGELLCNSPLFGEENPAGQLAEIARTIGSPSEKELVAMNPTYNQPIPSFTRVPWEHILPPTVPNDAISLLDQLLQYDPTSRLTAPQAMAHPFFDELRDPQLHPKYTNLHNYTKSELVLFKDSQLLDKLLPCRLLQQLSSEDLAIVGKSKR
uniref:Shaggy-related protein kinase epsilon n=2 Tax=Lygus hesperus TaxID=30085 RepID=A0A0A9YFG9_LYGHE